MVISGYDDVEVRAEKDLNDGSLVGTVLQKQIDLAILSDFAPNLVEDMVVHALNDGFVVIDEPIVNFVAVTNET